MTTGALARRIVIVTPEARPVGPPLRARGVEVVERFDLADVADEPSLVEGLAGAFAVVAGGERYPRDVLERLRGLRAIVRFGVGYDAIDLQAASDAGVAVLTTPGANAEAVADMALALLLSCIRELPALDRSVRNGVWKPATASRDLARSTVAIVGLGAIGRAVAARLRGFGCELLGVEPEPDEDFLVRSHIELTTLDDALVRADAVTLHAPLTPSTRHLLGARELALLPSHAVVVNTSRGGLIDQAALVAALGAGRLAGAGLDVFEEEPLPAGDPLLSLPNTVVAPHVASSTRLGVSETCDAVLDRLVKLLEGTLPDGCLSAPGWTSPPR